MYHADCLEKVKNEVFPIFVETGEVRGVELQLIRKDGSKIDVSLNVSAVRDEQGKVLHSRSIWRDITERKRVEEELRKANRALKALSECNQAVVRATEESLLLHDICQIIVEVRERC